MKIHHKTIIWCYLPRGGKKKYHYLLWTKFFLQTKLKAVISNRRFGHMLVLSFKLEKIYLTQFREKLNWFDIIKKQLEHDFKTQIWEEKKKKPKYEIWYVFLVAVQANTQRCHPLHMKPVNLWYYQRLITSTGFSKIWEQVVQWLPVKSEGQYRNLRTVEQADHSTKSS